MAVHVSIAAKEKKEATYYSPKQESHGQQKLLVVERLGGTLQGGNRDRQLATARVRKNCGPKKTIKESGWRRGYTNFLRSRVTNQRRESFMAKGLRERRKMRRRAGATNCRPAASKQNGQRKERRTGGLLWLSWVRCRDGAEVALEQKKSLTEEALKQCFERFRTSWESAEIKTEVVAAKA